MSLPEYPKWVEALGEEYNPYKGYAGPQNNKLLSALIPEKLYRIDLNPAFFGHDGDYAIGGNKQDRWRADVSMLGTGLFIIENWPVSYWIYGLNWARKGLARRRFLKYFEAVRAKGAESFNFITSNIDFMTNY